MQLTLTGVTLGMAFGQLLAGPMSDGVGRRAPLPSQATMSDSHRGERAAEGAHHGSS